MSSWLRRIAGQVEESTGIASLHETQSESYLAGHVMRRAGELGISPMSLVLRLEVEPQGTMEWQRLIAGLTNGQTSFFRDREQFEALGVVLNEMAARKGGRRLRIWSAACSTGEEVYSLAILCRLHNLEATILGSDINQVFLAHAREGEYDEWALRNLDEREKRAFFEESNGRYRVDDGLRERVRFEQHNLVREHAIRSDVGDGRWDLIVCRNVFMYFRRQRMAGACRGLAEALAPEGSLVLAACESLHGLDLPLCPSTIAGRVFYGNAVGPGSRQSRAATEPDATPVRSDKSETQTCDSPAPSTAELAHEQAFEAPDADHVSQETSAPGVGDLLDLGHLYLKQHRFDAAIEAYERAESADSLLSEVHLFKGLVLRKQGRWEEAGRAFRQALFLAPASWQAAYLLAGVHERMGRRREAIRERICTLRLLDEYPGAVSFLSSPAFVEWFCPSAADVRRALKVQAT